MIASLPIAILYHTTEKNHSENLKGYLCASPKNSYCNRSEGGAQKQAIDLFHNPETPPVTGENFPVFCQKWEKPSCLMCILKVMEHV